MASTERASPLAAWSGRFAQASSAPARFRIGEAPLCAQINIRGDATSASFIEAARTILPFDLPVAANSWVGNTECSALWLGPDEWLVVAPDHRRVEISTALQAALHSMHHSVTDVSANRTAIEVAGADARIVLAKGCPLDLHSEGFKPGQSAQTLLAKASIILQCVDERPAFLIRVRNSFADYLASWLVDAASECARSRALDTNRIAARLAGTSRVANGR